MSIKTIFICRKHEWYADKLEEKGLLRERNGEMCALTCALQTGISAATQCQGAFTGTFVNIDENDYSRIRTMDA